MIKVGIVGAGRSAEAHLNVLKELGDIFLPVVISDPVVENAMRFAQEFKVLHIYRDYKDMLKEEKIDLAVVAAPNGLHYKISKDLIEKGVNILVEKPLALSYHEA